MNISYVNKIDPVANGQQPDYKDLNLKFNMWNPAYDTSGYRPAGNAIDSLMHGPWSDPQDSKGYTYTDLMGRKYAMDGSDEAQQAARDAQIADFASSERRGGSFLGNPVMQERLKFEDQLRNSIGGKQAKRSSDDEDEEEQPAKPDIRERVKQILYGDNDYNRNWVASANRGDALNKAPVDNPHGGSTNPNMVKAYLASDQRQKDIEEAKKYQEYLKYLEYQKQLAAQAAQAAQQQAYSAPAQESVVSNNLLDESTIPTNGTENFDYGQGATPSANTHTTMTASERSARASSAGAFNPDGTPKHIWKSEYTDPISKWLNRVYGRPIV